MNHPQPHQHIVCECQLTLAERERMKVAGRNYIRGYQAGLRRAQHEITKQINAALAQTERQLEDLEAGR